MVAVDIMGAVFLCGLNLDFLCWLACLLAADGELAGHPKPCVDGEMSSAKLSRVNPDVFSRHFYQSLALCEA